MTGSAGRKTKSSREREDGRQREEEKFPNRGRFTKVLMKDSTGGSRMREHILSTPLNTLAANGERERMERA